MKQERLSYKNTPVHRIVPDFVVQMGDITVGDGTGGTAARLTPHRLGRTRVHTSHTLLLIPCVHFIVRVLRLCVFLITYGGSSLEQNLQVVSPPINGTFRPSSIVRSVLTTCVVYTLFELIGRCQRGLTVCNYDARIQ